MTDDEFLQGINNLIAEAPKAGLCAMPFQVIRDYVTGLIAEKNDLKSRNEPMRVNSYKLYAGQCPRCGVVFLDDSTAYCGNCGQALEWRKDK